MFLAPGGAPKRGSRIGFEQQANEQKERFNRHGRYRDVQGGPLVIENPLLDGKVVVLDSLLSEHQPIVDVEMKEFTGFTVESQVVLEALKTLDGRRHHSFEPERFEAVFEIGSV
jgi:hypothetical protein